MTTARNFQLIDGGLLPMRTQACPDAAAQEAAPMAGSFDLDAAQAGNGLRDALLTSLLVVYPAFSTVAAVVIALLLKGADA